MVYLIVLLSVLSRFIPHVWNFSPVYGALLFAGARLKKGESVWYPLALLAASDFVLTDVIYGLHTGWKEVIQLLAFATIILMGWLLRSRINPSRVGSASVAAATAFYFISNFGVWLGWQTYPPSAAGLVDCYAAGIPFYGYSLVSTILFAAVLFGSEHWYARRAGRIAAEI